MSNAARLTRKLSTPQRRMRKVATLHNTRDIEKETPTRERVVFPPIIQSCLDHYTQWSSQNHRDLVNYVLAVKKTAEHKEDDALAQKLLDALVLSVGETPDSNAQFFISTLFYHGKGLFKENKPIGFQWHLAACASGHQQALFNMGTIFRKGECGLVREDHAIAAAFWKFAADGGHILALYSYAYCLYLGDGTPENKEESIKILKKCAEEHLIPEAQYKYGQALRKGEGVTKNLNEAFENVRLAEAQGHELATQLLASMYFLGEGTIVNKPKSAELYKKSAETGNTTSQYNYATMLLLGDGIPTNTQEAIRLFEKLAESGFSPAQHALALCYSSGNGVAQNKRKAFELYQAAASKNHVKSFFQLGKMMETGDGVEKDLLAAFRYYRSSLESGEPALDKIKSLFTTTLQKETQYCY